MSIDALTLKRCVLDAMPLDADDASARDARQSQTALGKDILSHRLRALLAGRPQARANAARSAELVMMR